MFGCRREQRFGRGGRQPALVPRILWEAFRPRVVFRLLLHVRGGRARPARRFVVVEGIADRWFRLVSRLRLFAVLRASSSSAAPLPARSVRDALGPVREEIVGVDDEIVGVARAGPVIRRPRLGRRSANSRRLVERRQRILLSLPVVVVVFEERIDPRAAPGGGVVRAGSGRGRGGRRPPVAAGPQRLGGGGGGVGPLPVLPVTTPPQGLPDDGAPLPDRAESGPGGGEPVQLAPDAAKARAALAERRLELGGRRPFAVADAGDGVAGGVRAGGVGVAALACAILPDAPGAAEAGALGGGERRGGEFSAAEARALGEVRAKFGRLLAERLRHDLRAPLDDPQRAFRRKRTAWRLSIEN
mmetsp:Transcript_57929/g.122894  ORF Transcript_57929/g.122894 Transcript_57929/m.122894 type:complete len:358 (-) Transcript_57929:257-1330(-)